MDLASEFEQREGLSRLIGPSVTSSPGLRDWNLDAGPRTKRSVVMITFDSAENV